MAVEVRVPTLGESVTEATVASWFKQPGEAVAADEALCELETDKVSVEVPSPAAGKLVEHVAAEGDTVEVDALLATLEEGAEAEAEPEAGEAGGGDGEAKGRDEPGYGDRGEADEKPKEKKAEDKPKDAKKETADAPAKGDVEDAPSAKMMMEEKGLKPEQVEGTGRGGRIMKEDVLRAIEQIGTKAEAPKQAPRAPVPVADAEREKRVKMTRLRQTIARRLKDAQNTAAMLTTYNEVDMTAVMGLRSEYKDLFEKKHGVKLGFMGFFVKACTHALKEIPAVNAEIDGAEIIYKHYCHVGVAVGTPQGLVVPVIRDADAIGFAEIESTITDFGRRARDGKLKMEEMQGGTFTISNGGVYGSLMSSPILNPPQSGILGMHKIQERPMVLGGEIVARPMMYLALSYDHRIVDGKEAVTFLVRVKESLEDPRRLLMDL